MEPSIAAIAEILPNPSCFPAGKSPCVLFLMCLSLSAQTAWQCSPVSSGGTAFRRLCSLEPACPGSARAQQELKSQPWHSHQGESQARDQEEATAWPPPNNWRKGAMTLANTLGMGTAAHAGDRPAPGPAASQPDALPWCCPTCMGSFEGTFPRFQQRSMGAQAIRAVPGMRCTVAEVHGVVHGAQCLAGTARCTVQGGCCIAQCGVLSAECPQCLVRCPWCPSAVCPGAVPTVLSMACPGTVCAGVVPQCPARCLSAQRGVSQYAV